MSEPDLMTPEAMRQALRERRRGRLGLWIDVVGGEIPPGAHTQKDMLEAFRAKLKARGDRGVANLIKNLMLEPRNPFEPVKRRLPRREVVAVGALVAVLIGAVVWFNFLAVR